MLDEGLSGAGDETVFGTAQGERRCIVTVDRGFGDIRLYPPVAHAGIIVLRPPEQSAAAVVASARQLLEHHDLEQFTGCIVVVVEHLVRVRRPEP